MLHEEYSVKLLIIPHIPDPYPAYTSAAQHHRAHTRLTARPASSPGTHLVALRAHPLRVSELCGTRYGGVLLYRVLFVQIY